MEGTTMGGALSAEKKLSQTESQFNFTNIELERLAKIVQTLGEKLSPVLRECPPKDSETAKTPEENLVGIANGIRDIGKGIAGQEKKLRDISERLEI